MGRADQLNAAFYQLRRRANASRAALATSEEKAQFLEDSLLRVQRPVLNSIRRGVKRIAVRCPRKVGKSYLAMVIAVAGALRKNRANWVIIGLTRPSIQAIYWKALQELDKALDLKAHFQHTALVMNLPNGSTVSLTGAENRAEIEKLRGPAYHGAIVDECKSFNAVVFHELVFDVLGPALKKDRGPLLIIGTPGEVLQGPFYEATQQPAPVVKGKPLNRWAFHRGEPVPDQPREATWELHTWTQEDNTAVPHLWEEGLKEKAEAGWSDDHPTWRREYLGEWVAGDSVIVYRYRADRHDYDPDGPGPWGLPHQGPWRLVMGIDLGSKDPSAVVVWAYSENDPALWEVYSEKRQHQNGRQIAEWVAQVEAELGQAPEARVVDQAGLALMFVDTLAEDYGLVLEPAEKREKLDHIAVFNTDLDQWPNPRIRTRRGSVLGDELAGNRWLESSLGTERRKEDPRTPNDLCDAALYAFR
ncbi:MAG TPA: terminase family protein, partial [Gemmatimonadales bacterium]|nr:terminase family protein [Gemmatimonadales bacterium]